MPLSVFLTSYDIGTFDSQQLEQKLLANTGMMLDDASQSAAEGNTDLNITPATSRFIRKIDSNSILPDLFDDHT
ncbi:uncharacterized protein H6S33_001872 [Morchella sextelata]|uniref:uncharacterized protein n=1 Tax=Morchella sextelata TaxID=1174677 RepID=UPI001D053AC7|nr:uncharacterized protein H6S33_001872 [Morchella sextelata]KAH0608738.1 hypothetical protein H6S33_001872 [Morchella sextelata]